MDGCIFCEKIQGDDAEEHILYRGDHCYVVLNKFPYSNGHMMVVPYEHVSSLEDLDGTAMLEMMRLVQESLRILRETQHPQGFNVGINIGSAGGAGVAAHIHMHIVPRWEGDANYMTVIAETRVIPEMLDDTYAALRPVFDELDMT
ncbi:MAG: HIT family protein [Anaerolineae bacterium]